MTRYCLTEINKLIDRYIAKGGEINEIQKGVLGWGKLLLTGEGLKTIIIQEVFVNEWTSSHTVRKYNRTPQKYLNA